MNASGDRPHWTELPLFQIRAARDAGFLLALFAGGVLVWSFRVVTVPLLLAFVCTILVDPSVRRLEAWGIPRWLSAVAALLALLGLASAFGVIGFPPLIDELQRLLATLPSRLRELGAPASLTDALGLSQLNGGEKTMNLVSKLGGAVQLVGGTIVSSLSLLVVVVFTLSMFVFFTVRYPSSRRIEELLRPKSAKIVRKMLDVFQGYLRGQFLVALWTTFGFAVGFSLSGVPFALVAAAIGGVFSIIPNGQLLGWLCAIVFGAMEGFDATGRFVWLPIFLYPTIVYAITQSAETFLITPLVQGSAVRIHPLAVLGSLIAGASLGGLLGVFFAVPLTACGAVLMRDVLVPAMEARAARGRVR